MPPNALSSYSKNGHNLEFLRCGECGLIWRDSLKCPDEREYNADYFEEHGYKRKKAHRTRKANLFFQIIEDFSGPGTMLEVGPGMGESMLCARKRGWQVQGLDISDFAIQECANDRLDVKKGSLEKHDLNQQYDLVFMKHVLEHYKDPFQALGEARKLLNRKGLFFAIVPNAEYSKAEELRSRHRFYSHDGNGVEHHVYFTPETLKNLFRHSGFEILQEGLPEFLEKGDNIFSFLERNIRNALPFLGTNREIMLLGRKID